MKKEDKVPRLSRDDLLSIASDNGFLDLSSCLSNSKFCDISVIDPVFESNFFTSAFGDNSTRMKRITSQVIHTLAFCEVERIANEAIRDFIAQGGTVEDVVEMRSIRTRAVNAIRERRIYLDKDRPQIRDYDVDYDTRPLDIHMWIRGAKYREGHPVRNIFSGHFFGSRREEACIVLATEGYTDLLRYFLQHIDGWDAISELIVVRIACE